MAKDTLNGSFFSCADTDSTKGEEYEQFYKTAQLVCGLVVFPALCIPGIIGNIFALVVFHHKDMRTPTSVSLSALALSDIIKLVNDLLYFIVVVVSLSDPLLGDRMLSILYPTAHYIFNLAACLTAWLTVLVASERYIYVCHPLRAKTICTMKSATIVCVCVFVTMSIVTLPSALRYEMRTIHDDFNQTCVSVVPTGLGRNAAFIAVYSWVQSFLRAFIPVPILLYLNGRIIRELRREHVRGKKLSSRNRITLMLVVVVTLFLVCLTPDAVMSTVIGKGYVEEDNLVKGIREITDSLLTLNSAAGFFIYISMSVQFRSTFSKIFCGHGPKDDESTIKTPP